MNQRMGVGQEKEVGGVESDVVMGTIFLFPCSIWNAPFGNWDVTLPRGVRAAGDGVSHAES